MSKEKFTQATEQGHGEFKILNAREMLLDLICTTMRLYYGDIVTALNCSLEYDPAENDYDLTFELSEENGEEINLQAEKIATEYLTELAELSDKAVTAVNPQSGQLCINTKSELLDLVIDHCYKKGYKIADISLPESLPTGAENPDKKTDDSDEGLLLSVAPVRIYLNYGAYLAAARCALQELHAKNLNKTEINLSICIKLTEEKIKLEERKDPKIEKAIFLPEFFLN